MKAANAQPEIVTRNGKPVSVILPIKQYQEMIERLEDAEDVAWLKRARRKKLHFRPLEEVLAEVSRHAYQKGREALDEFLECFPTVRREMTHRVLERSKDALLQPA